MHIMINIPEEIYQKIKGATLICGRRNNKTFDYILFNAVAAGTPLPKGHGKLIEVDEVKKRYPIMENDFGMVVNEGLHKELDNIPTILEADTESEESE